MLFLGIHVFGIHVFGIHVFSIHDKSDMARPPPNGSRPAHGRRSPSPVRRSLVDEGGRYQQIIDVEDIARVLSSILGIGHRRSKRLPDWIRGSCL